MNNYYSLIKMENGLKTRLKQIELEKSILLYRKIDNNLVNYLKELTDEETNIKHELLITQKNVDISRLNYDFEKKKMSYTSYKDSLDIINDYYDGLIDFDNKIMKKTLK